MAFIVLVAVGADYNIPGWNAIRYHPDDPLDGCNHLCRNDFRSELVAVGLATENQAGDAAGRRRRRFDRERQRLKAAEDSQAVCDVVHDVTKVFVPRVKARRSVGRAARLGK
jgi:hypothetical protein